MNKYPQYEVDAIVVGTGWTGSIVIDHLLRLGKKVLVIERGNDELYFPDSFKNSWSEATKTSVHGERLITENSWSGANAFIDLALSENTNPNFRFDYNMKLGYGGSGAVWSGRAWRMLASDFKTESIYGYGTDWPINYEDLAPFYSEFERRFNVSGPINNKAWPWEQSFGYPPFKQSYLDSVIGDSLQRYFDFIPTANAVKNAPIKEGGCIGARSCVQFCPSNALFRPYHHLIEPHRTNQNLNFVFDAQVTHLEIGAGNEIDRVWISKDGHTRQYLTAPHVFLCGNTIENLRVLLNSEKETQKPVANSSSTLGKYFASHGATVFDIESERELFVGRGRPSTSAAINQAISRDNEKLNSYMLEVFNMDWSNGSGFMAFYKNRKKSGHWGRSLFDHASRLNYRTKLALIFELEMQGSNQVTLSRQLDNKGIPIAKIDFTLSERDMATFEFTKTYENKFRNSPNIRDCKIEGWGLNGNHPLGGYRMGKDPNRSVVDTYCRSHDHPNLHILGGGVFNSTSCFNPTQTIASLALRAMSDPNLLHRR